MMNVVMLSFANKPIMPSVFMFSVVIPNVLTPSNVGAVTLALGDTFPETIILKGKEKFRCQCKEEFFSSDMPPKNKLECLYLEFFWMTQYQYFYSLAL